MVLAVGLGSCGNFGDINKSTTNPPPALYNWSAQDSYSTSKLSDVFFINTNQGWIVGDSITLLSTTNAGTDWPQVPSTSIIRNLRSVFFIDALTGWMTSGSDANPVDGHVFISKMGGAYPTQQDMTDRPLNTIFFLDKNTGWAAGDSSILIHTDNGGVNWTRTSIGTNDKIFDLHFFPPEMGWAATNRGIYRTKDGATWKNEDLGIPSDIRAVHFVDTLHGWACGSANKIFRRQRDVNNNPVWTASSITSEPVSAVWNDIFFVNEQTGWVVGNDVYKTTDGGTTWMQETTAVKVNFNAIYMVSGSTGWIVGDGGNVLTYTP